MDTSDKDIEFDENGLCNNCREYFEKVKTRVIKGKVGEQKVKEIVDEINKTPKNQKYNCLVGISGGLDSTYALYLAKSLGLKPLAFHFDNSWGSKTSVKNIMRALKELDIDLETYVVDWEEFKDLQLAYLKASVMDMEALTDHAFKKLLYQTAANHNIKYIITGTNFETEGFMPKSWAYSKSDYINIKDIHKKFGNVPLKTFPIFNLFNRFYYQILKDIKTIEILNYVPYNREKIKKIVSENCGWEDYGKKHGESTFTRFFQEYYLPKKFNIDKRRAHLSVLVCAGQITRDEALTEVKKPIFEEDTLSKDKEFVVRKFGLTEKEFDDLINLPPKSHYDYKNGDKMLRFLRKAYYKTLKPIYF